MDARPKQRLKFSSILLQSLNLYIAKFRVFLGILLLPAITVSLVSVGLISLILGFSGSGSQADPSTFQFTLSTTQWIIVALAAFVIAIVVSVSMAASVYGASNAGAGGLKGAFTKMQSKSMQIFWMQCVIYVLAFRFSPWTALLFWLLVALAVPTALLEQLGPSDSMDRAWKLSHGYRTKILLIEIALLVLPGLFVFVAGGLIRPNGPAYKLSTALRTASAWVMPLILLFPIQFMFVAITRVYQALAVEPEQTLHAQVASSVNN
jgi:hypothetical protein